MRKISSLLLLLFAGWQLTFAQAEVAKFKSDLLKANYLLRTEIKGKFVNTDFGTLWTQTENQYVYGFIGNNYQRIRIKFINITKSKTQPDTYNVLGKSKVKDNIEAFSGTLHITNIRKTKETALGVDDELKGKGLKGQFVIIGDYNFTENKGGNHPGIFKGSFRSDFYLDKNNKYHYDNIEEYADGYSNNEFVGQWLSYDGKLVKRCNWGDYRIPNSGNFDIGAGEFSPDGKYLKYGWQDVRNMDLHSIAGKKGFAAEKVTWWK